MHLRSKRFVLLGICALGLTLFLCARASAEWGTDANHKPIITAGVITAPINTANESRCSSRQALIRAVRSAFDPKRPRQLLVYVHGYYTSFVTAVETAMALQKGLQFPGPVVVYSWPARKTSVLAYKTDEANALWSMPHFTSFLDNISKAVPRMSVSFAATVSARASPPTESHSTVAIVATTASDAPFCSRRTSSQQT